MFFTLECFSCGMPVGYLYYMLELARVCNQSTNSEEIVSLLGRIEKEHGESTARIVDFVLTSIVHFKTYGSNQSVQALVDQYHLIYPYADNQLPAHTANSPTLKKLFDLLFEDYTRGRIQINALDDRPYTNTIRQLLSDNHITRMCCRNVLLTNVDFY